MVSITENKRCLKTKKATNVAFLLNMVREGGVEPPHQRYWYLKPARLPIPPPSHEIKNQRTTTAQTQLTTFRAQRRGANYAYAHRQNQRIVLTQQ